MITLDMVRAGYDAGYIRLINAETVNGDGVACAIGDNWFYFGGITAENMTAEEYRRDIPIDDIVQDIYAVLEDFRTDFEDEYLYYEYYLREKIHNAEITKNPEGEAELKIVDSFVAEDLASVYSVSLAHGFFIDVKVFDNSDLIYIMQNHDGSTVYGIAGTEAPIPNYNYDETSVIQFVKDFHVKQKEQYKDSLSVQIQSASTHSAETLNNSNTKIKEPEHEL